MKNALVAVAGLGLTAALIYFLFLPAFRGELILQSYLEIGSFRLHYYGLILGTAILTAYFVSRTNAWRFGLSKDEVDKFAFWLVLVSFLCARALFVLVESESYTSLIDAFKIWDGGLAMYGAVIGGATFTYFYTRNKAYSHWQLLDLVALSMPLAQAIGRFGNFINYEVYGSVTDVPWKMFVPATGQYHHPTFLYEALLSLALFAFLFKYRGRLKPGVTALTYLAAYSLIRFVLEFVRIDEFSLNGLPVNTVLAGGLFLLAVMLFLTRHYRQK